ncbi:MAG: hypothetical protein K2G35_07040 [Duncaniella sp.]|nr:hypothetical protein [Duncaniella sp.]
MIKILKTRDYNVKLKATIHRSGRLGFTSDTASTLSLSNQSFVKFAIDDEDDNAMYLLLTSKEDEDSFKVIKSGEYYYLPTTLMFESLGFDYKKFNIMFDLIRMSEYDELLDGQVYKLNKRILMRKERKNKE